MATLRFKVVEEAFRRKAVVVDAPASKVSDYYGCCVFNRETMKKYLSRETCSIVLNAIDTGVPLDREIANHVAAGMKMWAMELGATHYTHWFHPLTDGTAEKHDSFIEHAGKGLVTE